MPKQRSALCWVTQKQSWRLWATKIAMHVTQCCSWNNARMGTETLPEPWGAHRNLDKGGDSTDKCGACCWAGGEEKLQGGTRWWGSRKTLCGHKYLSPPKYGVTCTAATTTEEMEERGSAVIKEGVAPAPALETRGWNTASLSGAKNPWRDIAGSGWLVGLSDQTCHTCLGHGCRCSRSALTVVINRWQLTV